MRGVPKALADDPKAWLEAWQMPYGDSGSSASGDRPGFEVRAHVNGRKVEVELLRDLGSSTTLEARYNDAGQLVSVRLGNSQGLSPAVLRRFPWVRWLTVVDSYARAKRNSVSPEQHQKLNTDAMKELAGKRSRSVVAPKRPGRAGHPDSFYKGIAERYLALRQEGCSKPTATLAKERHVSRNTSAGYVRVARERNFLPKARGNRPG